MRNPSNTAKNHIGVSKYRSEQNKPALSALYDIDSKFSFVFSQKFPLSRRKMFFFQLNNQVQQL